MLASASIVSSRASITLATRHQTDAANKMLPPTREAARALFMEWRLAWEYGKMAHCPGCSRRRG